MYFQDKDRQAFVQRIKVIPNLSREDEYNDVLSWQEHGDEKARNRLVEAHLKYVMNFASQRPAHLFMDAMSAGTIGLIKAIDKFDIQRGYRLSTFAQWDIRAEMGIDPSLKKGLVKLPTSSGFKQMAANLKKSLRKVSGDKLEYDAEDLMKAAEDLRVPYETVRDYYLSVAHGVTSLNTPIGDGDGNTEFGDMLEDTNAPNPESILIEEDTRQRRALLLQQAFAKAGLDDRERDILLARRLTEDKKALNVLGEKYEVSKERIRQIEVAAFKKVQAFMLNARDVTEPTVAYLQKPQRKIRKLKTPIEFDRVAAKPIEKETVARPERKKSAVAIVKRQSFFRKRQSEMVDLINNRAEQKNIDAEALFVEEGASDTLRILFPELSRVEVEIIAEKYLSAVPKNNAQIARNLGYKINSVSVRASQAFAKIRASVQQGRVLTPEKISVKLPASVPG